MKLRALERDYERTIAADRKTQEDFELKGKFENLSFNNVEFKNENDIVEEDKGNDQISQNEKKEGSPVEEKNPSDEKNKDSEEEEEEDDTCMYEKLGENENEDGDEDEDNEVSLL
jgi:hypothetical protein